MAFDRRRNSSRARAGGERGGRGEGVVSKLKGASGSTRNTDSDEDLIDTGRCRSAKLCKVAAAVGFRFGWDVVRDDPAPRN